MIQPHLAGVHKLHDAKLWEAAMKAMRNFWAREWLMRDIGAKHGVNDVSTIIKIAQTAGLLSSNAEMTEAVQIYVTTNRHRVEVLKHDTIVYPI
jgi:hypothetical protein